MHERVAAAVAEELAHRARRVRADVEHRRRLGRRGRDDDGVAIAPSLFERPHDLRDGRLLLPDRVVDADDAGALLVDDRVDGDGGLAGLAVADDQLALAAADRDHRVDGLDARSAAAPCTGCRSTTPGAMRSIGENCFVAIGPLPSIGWPSALTTRPSSSSPTGTEMMRPVRLTVSPSLISLEVAEQHGADAVFLEVQRDAEDAVRELEHLAGHGALDAVHARDAVADRDDGADFGHVHVDGEAADLLADDLGDVFSLDGHRYTFSTSFWRMRASWVVTLPSYTVLPTRATTPPMMAGSTRVETSTCLPLACPSAAADTIGGLRGKRHRGRDLGRHDVRRSSSRVRYAAARSGTSRRLPRSAKPPAASRRSASIRGWTR